MEYTTNEKYAKIKEHVLQSASNNPVEIAINIMNNEFMSIHGPEHHFLDGAAFLTAYKNAGGNKKLVIENNANGRKPVGFFSARRNILVGPRALH